MTPEDALRAWLDAHPARPAAGWDEGGEQRASQIAESWDAETRTYRRLGPRRDHGRPHLTERTIA